MTWAARRQLTYFSITAGLVLILIGVPFYLWWYKPPTCFDGKKNGTELGVDCGGSCTRLCSAIELDPIIVWQQAFEVVPGVYNAVAYIQNPNIAAEAFSVPYTFSFLDGTGKVIAERKGKAYIPPGKNFAVFESGISIPKVEGQLHTSFELEKGFTWLATSGTLPQLVIKNQQVSDLSKSPTVNADVQNPSFTDLARINATAIVYDTEGNAVAASRTYLDSLRKQSLAHLVFTWPQTFKGQVTSCEQPSDIVLAIDRSGSMASDKVNPPEPLTSVKNAALSFVNGLRKNDTVALVSFATEATNPIDELLTSDKALVRSSIQNIVIKKGGLQYTNIYDALKRSLEELSSNRHRPESKKIIVLLTDGKPTYPEKKGEPNYPTDAALSAAHDAQTEGVEIYTIGLGKDIDETFLESVSGFTERFYKAPSSSDLESVYTKIGAALCKLGPAKVEILLDIIPRSPINSPAF